MSISAAESITHLDLDSAIKSKQLTAGFEPFVSLRKLEARGVELHLVWQHPQYGPLVPGLFMPFVAAEGRTREITGFMLREAARAAADWRRAGLNWSVSVNVPLEDLVDGTLPSTIGVLLDEFNLPPEAFIIDIGESDLMARSAQALPAITGLRALGCGVALDSAPGEAMIQDLRGLPFTEIKVSGTAIVQFVDRTRHSGEGRVAARVYNARSNGLPVTAVGIDSEAMLWAVQRLDFDAAQGPYICAPCDPMALLRWEKIWRDAAEAIRTRKMTERRPLASGRTQRAKPEAAPMMAAALDAPAMPEPLTEPLAEIEPSAAPEIAPPPFVEEIFVEETSAAENPAEDSWAEDTDAADDAAIFKFESAEEPAAAIAEEIFAEDAPAADEPPPFVEEEPAGAEAPFAFEAASEDEERVSALEEAAAPPVSAKPAPAAPAEETLKLIPRSLPGISRPIMMSVQNQGPERFGFLKKLARKR